MSNMSYCRFENTLSDLRDCADNLYGNLDELSREELRARRGIIKICKEIVEDAKFNGEIEED